ncbi:MAG TPA: lysine 2,3-aminomutase [Bacillota bacterium]|nr:lysine 2,3-aminomutase [Bacillota bacterium]
MWSESVPGPATGSHRGSGAWPGVTVAEWDDWRWQVSNRISSIEQLAKVVHLSPAALLDVEECLKTFRMAITPYYASLIDPQDPGCPIRQQAIPTRAEVSQGQDDALDPLFEDTDSPVPGLTHRYPDRVLFIVTDQCSMYCRHCTRRRMAGQTDHAPTRAELEARLDYVRRTPCIRDVVLSGGDALLVSDALLDHLLGELRSIPHVEIVRLATRTPVVLPQRITPEFCRMVRKHHPVYVNTHFNHPSELTREAVGACERLADAGVPLGNQTVLLRGVNDCPHVMRRLMHGLLKARVRPYYLYQCDLSRGIQHFRTPTSRGIEIIEHLRGHTSGLAVPAYCIDGPGGAGKIPLGPEYVLSRSPEYLVLRNYEGAITAYREPPSGASVGDRCDTCGQPHDRQPSLGVAAVLDGQRTSLEPAEMERKLRRRRRPE